MAEVSAASQSAFCLLPPAVVGTEKKSLCGFLHDEGKTCFVSLFLIFVSSGGMIKIKAQPF